MSLLMNFMKVFTALWCLDIAMEIRTSKSRVKDTRMVKKEMNIEKIEVSQQNIEIIIMSHLH